MEKWFKRIFAAGGIALLAVALLWGVSKLVGASGAERDALAVMSKPVALSGKNAYAAVWLVDHPVPEAERESILAEDVRRYVARRPAGVDSHATAPAFRTSAESRYPTDRPDKAARNRLCDRNESCLDKVRSDLAGYAQLVKTHAAWFARAENMTRADHIRSPFPARLDVPMPPFVSSHAPATALAVRFAEGDQQGAIAATCRVMADWRRLAVGTDNLVAWAVAESQGGEGYGRLLADMLAEMPNDEPMPTECAKLLSAVQPNEVSMCHAMRGEFRFMSEVIDTMTLDLQRQKGVMQSVIYDGDMTRAMAAVPLAPYCSADADAAFEADKAVPSANYAGMFRLQCVSNYVGCVLANISSSSFDTYGQRHRDTLAAKRLLAALPWWRQQPDANSNPAAVLKRLPESYRSAAHPVALNSQNNALVMTMIGPNFEKKEWVMSLPGSKAGAQPSQN